MKLVKDTGSSIDQLFIWYMLFGFMMLTGGLDFLFSSGSSDGFTDSSSNSKRMLSLLAVYMVSLGFITLYPSKRLFDIAFHPLLLLVVFLPMISVSWSGDFNLTAKRSIAHALTLVFILSIAARVTLEEFFRAFLIVLAVTAVISLIIVVAMPGIGIAQGGANKGSFNAGFGHKANLGRICAMGLAIAFFFPAKDKMMKRLRWVCLIGFGILIVGSDSRIAWGTAAIAIVAGLVFKVMRWKTLDASLRALVFLFLFLAVTIPAALLFEDVIYASGRDLTFSGRTNLWQSAITVAQAKHPFSGAGYGAFWTKNSSIDVLRYMQHWGHMPSHGHNGYVDSWLEMGWVGLGTLVAVTIVAFFTIVTRLNDEKYGDYWFILLVLHIQFLFINLGGTISFKHSEIFWIFFLAPLFFRLQHLHKPMEAKAPNVVPRPDLYYPAHLRFPARRS